jgi:hypothetical protein
MPLTKYQPPSAMFLWPSQARVDKLIAKSKIYLRGKVNAETRSLFIKQVESVMWTYKLSPETINIAATKSIPEIEVFEITLKEPNLNYAVLRCIDNAIPFPILFILRFDGQVQPVAAYKRTSESNSNDWVITDYFAGAWQPAEIDRKKLPHAINLESLYTLLIRQHLSEPAKPNESLTAQIERIAAITAMQKKASRLQTKLKNEVQFKYKVEINSQLRQVLREIDALA